MDSPQQVQHKITALRAKLPAEEAALTTELRKPIHLKDPVSHYLAQSGLDETRKRITELERLLAGG